MRRKKAEENLLLSTSYFLPITYLPFAKTITHLNIVGFKAAVAGVKDKSLRGRPYIIAAENRHQEGNLRRYAARLRIPCRFSALEFLQDKNSTLKHSVQPHPCGGLKHERSLVLDCSPEAVRQGVTPGITLALAQRRVKDLIVLPPDIPAYEVMNKELERMAARYAPVWENDRAGNLYLDITGTTKLFGPPVDCSSRVLRDILEQTDIKPAAAVASNKLVSKVATRTIRPVGLIQVQAGTEAEFLDRQDIRILPGMGPGLLRTAAVTGIRKIGEIARLSDTEALALFGKKGPLLRNMALGIDCSCVEGRDSARCISQRVDFEEDTIEETAIIEAIETLAGHGGLQMRNEKLGMRNVRLGVIYSDGVEVQGFQKSKRLLVTDREIAAAACTVFKKTVTRRIRIRSIGLGFEDLVPLWYQPDLFEPETETKNKKLQAAVDKIQNRYGEGKIRRGVGK